MAVGPPSDISRFSGVAEIQAGYLIGPTAWLDENNGTVRPTTVQGHPAAVDPDPEQAVTAMRTAMAAIGAAGFTEAYAYTWSGGLNVNNDFAMQNTDGSFNPVWELENREISCRS